MLKHLWKLSSCIEISCWKELTQMLLISTRLYLMDKIADVM